MFDKIPCGYLCVEQNINEIHLREIVIAVEFKSKGIGTFLLEKIIEQAKSQFIPVRLGTFYSNRAIKLYRRLGFCEFDRTETHILMEWKMSDDRAE